MVPSTMEWPLAIESAPAQESAEPHGLHRVQKALSRDTAARRAAAEDAWAQHFPAFQSGDRAKAMQSLLVAAPEIQLPALRWIRKQLAAAPTEASPIRPALLLLEKTLGPASADDLFSLLSRFREEDRPLALRICIERGTVFLHARAAQWLTSADTTLARVSLEAFAEFAEPTALQGFLAATPLSSVSRATTDIALNNMAARAFPERILLPESWLAQDVCSPISLARFWTVYPDERTEDLLLDWFLNFVTTPANRLDFLQAIERGAASFRWRSISRKLTPLLRGKDIDPQAYELAWALHQMGEKNGDKFLLQDPKDRVKANPEDWRSRVALMRLEVDLGVFKDAYKNAVRVYGKLEGTRDLKRLTTQDWFYAARSSAGAHKTRHLERWLQNARLSAEQIREARKLPEFQRYLDKGAIGALLAIR
jgi:hypothetical protein